MWKNKWRVQKEACKGKKAYDKRGALTMKNFIREREGIEQEIYPCPICHKWHLTTKYDV